MLAHQQTRSFYTAQPQELTALPWLSGSYQTDTNGMGNSVSGHNDFAQWRGRPERIINTFCAGAQWSNITASSNYSRYTNTLYGDSTAVFTIGLVPGAKDANGNYIYTLAQAANNDPANPGVNYDANYYAIGQTLVNNRHEHAYVRPGWEMNGNWNAWPGTTDATAAANFRTAYQRFITQLRSAGWKGKSVFCTSNGIGKGSVGPDLCYPGDNYVDVIGVDAYDRGHTNKTPAQAWNFLLTNTGYGLTYWSQFCQAGASRLDSSSGAGALTTATAAKTFALPEWGLSNPQDNAGGGDNTYYIQQVYNFFSSVLPGMGVSPEFEAYFNKDVNPDPASASYECHRIDPGRTYPFINAAETYKQLFGGE